MRRFRGALSLALLLGSVNAGCVNFRPPPKPLSPRAAGNAPAPVWTAQAGRRLAGNVEVQDNILYAGGMDRKVYAVDLSNGDVRWSSRLSGMIVGGVLLAGDTLFVASSRPDGRVQALARSNGKRIWRIAVDPIGAPLAMVEGLLIAQTQRGNVMGLDPGTGKILWHHRLGTARAPATSAGNGAVIVSTTDSLFRVSLSDGKVTHQARSPGTVLGSWLPFRGALVAGTADSQVVSIDPGDLRQNWILPADAPILDTPATAGDTLFFATRTGSVYRVDPTPELKIKRIARLEWPITAPVTISGGQILLGGADGMIRGLKFDGTEVWRVQVWRPVEVSPVLLADGIIAIGGNGDLHRYKR
jgi:outer membrane protein assembly factor BamB